MSQGIGSTPAITVPYRGIDEWVRTAILSGGTALLALAALLAFWPRRGATPGYPIAAAVALGTLYAVPIVEHGPDSPYFDGAVFCILLAGFLWLERVRSDQLAVAVTCVVATAIVGAIVGPRLDSAPAVVRLRELRREARAHEGRGVLVDAQLRAADVVARRARAAAHQDQEPGLLEGDQSRRVRRRALAHGSAVARRPHPAAPEPQVGADDQGRRPRAALDAVHRRRQRPGHPPGRLAPGAAPERRHLRDLEQAAAPRRQLPGAGLLPAPERHPAQARPPPTTPATPRTSSSCRCPCGARPSASWTRRRASAWAPTPTVRFAPVRHRRRGRRRVAQRLRRSSRTATGSWPTRPTPSSTPSPSRSGARPRRPTTSCRPSSTASRTGPRYDENPPQRPYPLASFLFDTKSGYCQQFSGVMALMLRMGGVPARVASGFSPGTYNSERKDYVVRDTDAHSWVEAYFPPYGWVTFDPTPARVAGRLAARRHRHEPQRRPDPAAQLQRAPGPVGRPPVRGRRPRRRPRAQRRGRRLEAARRRRARRPRGPVQRRRALAAAHAVRDARARRGRAAARAAPLRARPVARRDARAPGEPARRLGRRGGLRARGARPPLRALDGAADARAAPRAAPPARHRASACAARCARGGRCRRCRRGALKDRLRRPYTPK